LVEASVTDEHRPRRRSRRLNDEEKKLWSAVARSVRPLKPGQAAEEPILMEPDGPPEPPPLRRAPPVVSAPPAAKPPPPLAPLGRRMRQRIGRGTEPIDRRIDLHGMTQGQAHDALAGFLRAAQGGGARLVLVITGKGIAAGARSDRDPFAERGVLKRQVPLWLKQAEFRDIVLGVEWAGVGHGGEGALYVKLRKKRGL
jgi:DNA-nicking Smr family endonuclease